mmetsp:Transcript_84/g.389  ORF Transcript_84/g.389 Transcript_84/m.389 type:complete len:207 (+) Transcript_84:1697-2317(+)
MRSKKHQRRRPGVHVWRRVRFRRGPNLARHKDRAAVLELAQDEDVHHHGRDADDAGDIHEPAQLFVHQGLPQHCLRVHPAGDISRQPLWLPGHIDDHEVDHARRDGGPVPRHDLHVSRPRQRGLRRRGRERRAGLSRERHVLGPGRVPGVPRADCAGIGARHAVSQATHPEATMGGEAAGRVLYRAGRPSQRGRQPGRPRAWRSRF